MTLVPILTAVLPQLVALFASLALTERNPGAIKRMQRHAALEQSMPDGSDAKAQLRALLDTETQKYVGRVTERLNRKINYGNLTGIILVIIFFAGATYSLILLAQVFWPAWIVAGGIGLFGVVLILAGGLPNLYKHETPEEIAARQAKRQEAKRARDQRRQKRQNS